MNDLLDAAQALRTLMNAQRQNNRLLRLSFPRDDAPADALMVANRLSAYEGMSRDFQFTVEVLSDNPDIALKDVMAKMVTLELLRADGSVRYFNGYVFDFRFVRQDGGFSYYDLVALPWLAFLRYRHDNYLFHGKTVQQQTTEIFNDYDMRDWQCKGLQGDAPMTDACQFDESDYNYLHRRWEALGWHYWYEHRKDGHTLMLCGDSTQAEPIDGSGQMLWQGRSGVRDSGLHSFSSIRTVAATAYAASSFDFKSPRPIRADAPTINKQGVVPKLEVYEYAGAYGYKNSADGRDFVRMRIEEIEAASKHFKAKGDDDHSQCGRSFVLSGHLDARSAGNEDSQFLILEARHEVSNNYETRQGSTAAYDVELTCLRKKIPWRPGRGFNSTEPKIYGVQTAIVVGPAGEEIYTDEYGRVKVQFHWDREGEYNEKSSAWVRVASTWAGSNFGFMAVPRIGQEVIVQWLDGNVDRPLITGRVFNQSNMPPWPLPDNKTQTGILSRSSHDGGYDNANALRFEDKKGQEEVWLHAEKDQRIEVEHDESHWVGNDRSKTIDHDETVHVKHDRTETVGNNETITVHNNRTEQVDQNETINIGANRTEEVGQNETISIGANQSITIGQNKTETVTIAKALTVGAGYAVSVGGAMNTAVGLAQLEEVGLNKSVMVGKTFNITAGDEFKITVGKSTMVMKSDGTVLINGTKFNFEASGPVQISGKDVDVN
ncbi:type VI secretion protein VgrG [Herbaspirillum rubrisubalbicans]|uniref:Type VI secretion protein VgrG n=2 Tax=Herbaspirillum rubrisubalbicans TaxID=80842 RepID=A0ABX9BV78_9BURK|nr:type VI secretion system tip protein TssI/VgrG [Herbaspirillum rubrisubalbicans]NQE49018.1 type VI secretion protein VgrG [Herbaspirillum rubrisubalbicans]QJP99863.1 type VI secretion system tip protein VgrG [Herbaspirillum rubrisubalbicans Os34]RAM61695.1 type VI secretion protein VgrG [Herbaspirillum rubrisubalbicans]RAN49523.1 type VI secretion protein VgrG [Herbaspirillum rubrisubalbicans]